MIFIQEVSIYLEWVLALKLHKDQIPNNYAEGKDQGLRGKLIRNPEKREGVKQDDIDILHYTLLVGIQNRLKTADGCQYIQRKRGDPMQRIQRRNNKDPRRQKIIPANGRHHLLYGYLFIIL
jgi:hypothetical protein